MASLSDCSGVGVAAGTISFTWNTTRPAPSLVSA